jgi:hypothetical protein
MPDTIRDGTGNGHLAKVLKDNRLSVISKNEPLQHSISVEFHQAYQAIGTATLSSGTVAALHFENQSTDHNMVVTYIRHQIIDAAGGTAFPNASNYYRIACGRKYASGGTIVEPANLFVGSGNISNVIVYEGAPVLTGTAIEIDRHYTKAAGDMNTFNKEGSLIVPPNQTIELSYVGDQTSGILYTRMSFAMEEVQ